jgi:EAL domain-containing protein (putative c-di-GMP-specific phosphodiesterase class I)
LQTVAEFVETGDIAKTLIDLGVDYLQGYYFGKALNHRPWVTDDKASNI